MPVIVVSSGLVDLRVPDGSLWDGERWIDALDRYYILRTEAEDAVVESKRIWLDTPFSLYAVQSELFLKPMSQYYHLYCVFQTIATP